MQPQIDSMKTILVFFLIFVIIPAGVFSETIRLKDGRVLRAEIIEETPQYIKVNIHGIPITYYRDQIKRIEGKRPISADTPREAPAHSASGKSPAQIFKEVSDEVVVVIAQMSSGVSQGSGFIIDRNGVVVTNFHVVGGAEEIEVKFKDGRAFPVVGIIDYDVNRDICVLKIDAYGLDTVALGNSNYLQPGSKVLVIGAPLGLEYSITEGLYSGKRKFLK